MSFSYYTLMMLGGGGPDNVMKGAEKVAAIKDCIDTIDPNAAKTVEKAQLGEYELGIMAHQLTLTLKNKGAPLQYADPKEGAVLQFSTAAVTKNAPNPKMAQLLLNELLSERVQKVLVEALNASPVNKNVKVSAELAAAGAPDPANMKKYIPIPTDAILVNRAKYLVDAAKVMSR